MSSTASISSSARSWRDIPQTIAPRAMSSTGRKRMIFANTKAIAGLLVACVSLWGGYELFQTWENNPAKLKAPVKTAPLKNISLRGQNLVLDQPWVVRTLALPKDPDLMELDLYALRERLMSSGQVRTAVLTRKFPDTLLVSLEERSPVARIKARFSSGPAELFLVARDGVVYQGACYKDDVVSTLPFLAGVSLKRSSGKLQPIDGMETLADLLSTARVNAPKLYQTWSVVSLEKLASDGQISVQSTDAGMVTFGTRDDFYKQIARLDYIIDQSRANTPATPLKSINLAVGEQVPVSFQIPLTDSTHVTTPPGRTAHTSPRVVPTDAQPRGTHATPSRPLQANSASFNHPLRRDF